MEQFKTLAFFSHPSDYVVFRLLLDQHTIRYVFTNETMIGILPFYSNSNGGIQLKVHPEDFDEAKHLLDQWNRTSHLHIV